MERDFEQTPWYNERRALRGLPGLMPDVIVPSTPNMLKGPQSAIEQRTAEFQKGYFERHPEKKNDQDVKRLFDDMNHAGYWHVLGQIDGKDANPHSNEKYTSDRLKAGEEAREWASNNFTKEERQEILGIIADTALKGIYSNYGQPGFRRGHTILYSHLVTKPNSSFAELVTPGLMKRLNNGRFWENLPELYTHQAPYSDEVADVLTNHADDLDPKFFKQGYEIFRRNGGEHDILVPDLSDLSREEIAKYWEFVKTLDQVVYAEKDKIADQEAARQAEQHPFQVGKKAFYTKPSNIDGDIAFLVRPYLHYIHTNAVKENRRFEGETLDSMFTDPVLQKYLEKSDMLREELANDMQNYLRGTASHATLILLNIPKPREMVARLLAKARSDKKDDWQAPSKENQLTGISRMLRQAGLSTNNLFAPNDAPLKR
jgi:hypothetical protein